MKSNNRILIVDDEASIRFILEKVLTAEGYVVHAAANCDEAIDLATANQFDVIMIDLMMPNKDGFQTISALHDIQPACGIIAMSGGGLASAECYFRVASKFGACRSLAKPFAKMAMLEAVEGEIGKLERLSA
jgi:DNA-binding NtrC family response regulator